MSQYRSDKNRYDFVTRKGYDHTIDRLKETLGRQKEAIRDLKRRIVALEEMFSD